jgi:RNA polymerase sigma-70 factor (ECF subfamily)
VNGGTDIAPSDAELMAGLARGEVGCLRLLFLRYGDAVTRVVRGTLERASSAEADDICQNVFLTVLDAAPRYRETGQLRSWLFGIAIRKARSWQRRRWFRATLMRRRIEEETASGIAEARDPETMVSRREMVERALAKMTTGQREVFLLRASEGLSGEEIAQALGISLNAVFMRLHRAHEVLGEEAVR